MGYTLLACASLVSQDPFYGGGGGEKKKVVGRKKRGRGKNAFCPNLFALVLYSSI